MTDIFEEEYPAEEYTDIEKTQMKFWVPADSFLELKKNQLIESFAGGVMLLEEGGKTKIAFERWRHGSTPGERVKVLVKKGDVNELYSFFDSVYPEQQRIEKEDIIRWREKIEQINSRLGNWQELTEADKKNLTGELLDVASEFPQIEAKDEDKMEARDKLRQAAFFKDSLNRDNPPASRAQLMRGLRGLQDWLQALEIIREKWDKKKEGVKNLILEFKKAMKIRTMAEAMKRGYSEQGNLQLELKRGEDEWIDVFEKLRIKLRKEFKPLQDLAIEPYSGYITAIEAVLNKKREDIVDREKAYRDFRAVELQADEIYNKVLSSLYAES